MSVDVMTHLGCAAPQHVSFKEQLLNTKVLVSLYDLIEDKVARRTQKDLDQLNLNFATLQRQSHDSQPNLKFPSFFQECGHVMDFISILRDYNEVHFWRCQHCNMGPLSLKSIKVFQKSDLIESSLAQMRMISEQQESSQQKQENVFISQFQNCFENFNLNSNPLESSLQISFDNKLRIENKLNLPMSSITQCSPLSTTTQASTLTHSTASSMNVRLGNKGVAVGKKVQSNANPGTQNGKANSPKQSKRSHGQREQEHGRNRSVIRGGLAENNLNYFNSDKAKQQSQLKKKRTVSSKKINELHSKEWYNLELDETTILYNKRLRYN